MLKESGIACVLNTRITGLMSCRWVKSGRKAELGIFNLRFSTLRKYFPEGFLNDSWNSRDHGVSRDSVGILWILREFRGFSRLPRKVYKVSEVSSPLVFGKGQNFSDTRAGILDFWEEKRGFFSELCKIVKRAKSFFLKVKIIHVKYQI